VKSEGILSPSEYFQKRTVGASTFDSRRTSTRHGSLAYSTRMAKTAEPKEESSLLAGLNPPSLSRPSSALHALAYTLAQSSSERRPNRV
jgi:hypothetical protein